MLTLILLLWVDCARDLRVLFCGFVLVVLYLWWVAAVRGVGLDGCFGLVLWYLPACGFCV